jgi:hypothetical protein
MYAEIREKIKVKSVGIKPPFILGSLIWAIMPAFPIRCKGIFVAKFPWSYDSTNSPLGRGARIAGGHQTPRPENNVDRKSLLLLAPLPQLLAQSFTQPSTALSQLRYTQEPDTAPKGVKLVIRHQQLFPFSLNDG